MNKKIIGTILRDVKLFLKTFRESSSPARTLPGMKSVRPVPFQVKLPRRPVSRHGDHPRAKLVPDAGADGRNLLLGYRITRVPEVAPDKGEELGDIAVLHEAVGRHR